MDGPADAVGHSRNSPSCQTRCKLVFATVVGAGAPVASLKLNPLPKEIPDESHDVDEGGRNSRKHVPAQ